MRPAGKARNRANRSGRRGRFAGKRPPARPGRFRWLVALGAFAVSVAAVVAAHGWADDDVAGMGRLRDALRDDGYSIVGLYVAAVLIGCAAQTPAAVRRRARLGFGWLAAGAFVAYGVVVAGLAVSLAAYAPDFDAGGGRGDPGGIYGAMLVCLLAGPALMALSGAVFPGGSAMGRKSFRGNVSAMAGVTALLGGATLVLLLAAIAVRRLPENVWIPRAGAGFLVIGAIAPGGLGAFAVFLAVVRLTGRSRPPGPSPGSPPGPSPGSPPGSPPGRSPGPSPTAPRGHGAGAGALLAAAGVHALIALLGAQLGRVLPAGLVLFLTITWLLAAGPSTAWYVRRAGRTRRGGRTRRPVPARPAEDAPDPG